MNRGIELLRELSLAFGPSGCEGNVADIVKKQALAYADEVTTDRLGSVIALYKGCGGGTKKLMLAAHMDEVGFMIKSIDDRGLLRPAGLSVWDGRVLTGRSVTVGNEERQIAGYMGAVPAHKSGGKTDFGSLYIDIGAKNKEEAEQYVRPGDFGTFRTDFEILGGEDPLIKGKAIDDRLGCAVLLDVLAGMAEADFRPQHDTYFCFTRREEVGASTAGVAAYKIAPDAAIILEATAVADVHGIPEQNQVGRQGDGPLVSLVDVGHMYDREMSQFLLDLGEKYHIPVQTKQFPSGYNDSKPISKVRSGVRCAAVSSPTRYIHNAACGVKVRDYHAMVRLLGHAAAEMVLK